MSSSSSLGVTMTLPAGALESRRAEELSRRKQRQEQQEQSAPLQPRRLAPQRKKKTTVSAAPIAVESREHLPISIPINYSDEGDADCEDDNINNEVGNITNNVADWTLSNADEKIRNYADDGDEGEEEQSYHGEIESVVENESNDEQDSIDEESDDGGFKLISEVDVPLDPPPSSIPMVLVDLEMLCGVVPYDQEEKEEIVAQLVEMLMGSQEDADEDGEKKECDNNPNYATKGDGISLDFDERVVELFESGVARHVDNMMPEAIACVEEEKKAADKTFSLSCKKSVYPLTLIPYPEFLSSESTPASRSTTRLWKLLNTSHESPLLNRLFKHLRNTSRSLIWKGDMYQELCSLARQEYKAQVQRQQMAEYNEWKETLRKERLEKLYDVRETFQLRVDVARRKHEAFVEERELRVERDLKRRGLYEYRIKSQKYTGKDMNSDNVEECYDEDGWRGAVNEDEIFGDDTDDADPDDGDEWSPLGLKIAITTPEDSIEAVQKAKLKKQLNNNLKQLEPITHSDNQTRKSERHQKLKDQTNATQSNFFEKKEAEIREALKTNEERITEAMLKNLEGKLQNVDELLETLQEEEWADEEDDTSQQSGMNLNASNQIDGELGATSEMTLLDQILAMILGALPKERSGEADDKLHFAFVKDEHSSIINEWKETFGRLPPFPSSEPEPEASEAKETISEMDTLDNHFGAGTVLNTGNYNWEKNNDLALIGNETSEWDEIDDWDAFFSSK